ncbi:hypothetical protein [Calidithermus chliarophilus]|uniref:hypothetical protein n=1 Tax=Calidithermus chliarophilus TaxID=52023 RepID=UPI0004151866|nr:hypothetical protein [Calidithermus chliarophilus]
MHRFLIGTVALLALLAGCTPAEPGGFSLDPNAVVLPEAEVDSVAASEMYVQTDKELKSGQVVISDEGDGLVRRITEATTIESRQVGAQIVRKVYLKTEEASLEEAVAAGDASLDFGDLQIGQDSLVQALPGVSVQDVTGKINISNVSFQPVQGVTVTLNGFVQQKLSPKFRLVINKAAGSGVPSVDVFEAALAGSLTASLQAKIVADKKFSLGAGTEKQIAQFAPLRQAFLVGAVPVVVVVTPRLVVGASGGADNQVTIQAGIQPTLSVNAGVKYDRDAEKKWVGVWTPPSFNLNPSFSYTVPSNGNGQLYAKMVLDVKLYGVAGPTLEAKPYVGMTFKPAPATATVRAGLGASGAVSAGFKVLGKGLELGTSALTYDEGKDFSCTTGGCTPASSASQ